MNILCWVWPILTGIICGIIGYYWGRRSKTETKTEVIDNSEQLKALEKKNSDLMADLKLCKEKREGLEVELAKVKADLEECKSKPSVSIPDVDTTAAFAAGAATAAITSEPATPDLPFDAAAAKAVFGKKIKQDDLKIVEGIGPKIEGLFHNFEVKTWKALSECSVEKCQEVLNSGGKRYEIHKPDTWPRQAKLAYEGKWEELLKWQDELDGGKLPS